jgi:gamma-glutamyltranspeptidase/glutathione hydrolase
MKRSVLFVAVFIAVSMVAVSFGQASSTVLQEVRAEHGMVAAASPLAAQVGVDILKAGGNAVDAAVATAFAMGVVEPNASGLGGEGMFVFYSTQEERAVVVDYRSTAPKGAAEAFYGKSMPSTGWKSIGTPGLVAGLAMALEKYGTMSLPEVLAPAIKLAEEGFPIPTTLAQMIEDSFQKIAADPGLASIYLIDGLPPFEGDILKNPQLASSLRKIAEGGPDVFYKGELAEAMASTVQANGGYLSLEDLAEYKAVIRWPVRINYRGYDIFIAPPPVGGATLANALAITENFDVASMGYPSAQAIHVMSEAIKRSFRDYREYVADPDFVNVPLQAMLSEDYAAARAGEFSLKKMTPHAQIKAGALAPEKAAATGTYGYESPSTTHISVVDKDRNMVAITQTISSFWGAGHAVPGTGIILNNEVYNFSSDTKAGNSIAPGKRMRTSICPTIVLKNREPFLTIGTPGGSRIVPTMTQLLSFIIDHKMGLQEAIETPRFYVREGSDVFEHESRMPAEVLEGLKALGYPINDNSALGAYDLYFGGAQGVMVDPETGWLRGAADPRRDGAAIGY